MQESELVQHAIELACVAHRNAVDKSGVPIFFHLAYVAGHGQTTDERVVGLLHDIIEDTEYTASDLRQEGFPEHIVEAIKLLSRTHDESYLSYINRVSTNPLAVAVKLIDLEHNMQLGRIPDPNDKDFARLKRYRQAYAHLVRIERSHRYDNEVRLINGLGTASLLDQYVMRYRCCHQEDYRIFACVLEQILTAICKQHAPLSIVQSRVKQADSLAKKCSRVGNNSLRPLDSFTDLAAARVIVTTRDELERVTQAIADLFEGERMEDITPARYQFNQFGYASVHFDNIIVHEPVMMGVDTRMEFTEGLKAEIQVRTICQHQYAVFTHDRVYKSDARLDDKIQRKLSRMAAILEEVDDDFDEMVNELDAARLLDEQIVLGDSWLGADAEDRCCPICPQRGTLRVGRKAICETILNGHALGATSLGDSQRRAKRSQNV
jgi:ppGpp synthetase/RelA/SpoT-type nucleotidyltranferase